MDKEQMQYSSTVCIVCSHTRGSHNGVTGNCYVAGCKCVKFKAM